MLKPHALIDSLSANLSYFFTQIHQGLPLPQKNFLHESIFGLIRAGHPIVAQMARQISRHDPFKPTVHTWNIISTMKTSSTKESKTI